MLATSLALYLARVELPDAAADSSPVAEARRLAVEVLRLLRPIARQSVRLMDDVARLCLALGHPDAAMRLLDARLERSESITAQQQLARAYVALRCHDAASALAATLTAERGDRQTVALLRGSVDGALLGHAPRTMGHCLAWARAGLWARSRR